MIISTWKTGGNAGKIFLGAIFSHSGKLFSKFLGKIFVIVLRDVIGLIKKFPIDFRLIIIQSFHWCYTWTALLSAWY